MSRLKQLQDWYAANCNGEWEHTSGVKIESLDNPGWWIKIQLLGTGLERMDFVPLSESVSETDWLDCRVVDGRFEGAGDSAKLEIILGTFLDWAKQHD